MSHECTEPGAAFGEMALLTDNGTRSASVIVDELTDLIVIDRALYSRCVRDVISQEFQQKDHFIAQHPHFRSWAPKYRKQLIMALEREVLSFDHVVTKQEAPVDAIYFIVSSVQSVVHSLHTFVNHHWQWCNYFRSKAVYREGYFQYFLPSFLSLSFLWSFPDSSYPFPFLFFPTAKWPLKSLSWIWEMIVSFPQPGKNDICSHQTRSLASEYTKMRLSYQKLLQLTCAVQ